MLEEKKNNLFRILSGIFLTNVILAELIGVKIFSAEATIGLEPANFKILGDFILDFNLTAGAIIWPVVFITTDIINEYFGKPGVKKVTFMSAGFVLYAFIVIYLVTDLPPAPFWLEVNNLDAENNPFNIDFAFGKIYRQGMGIIAGSLTAFVISQLLDVMVYQKIRQITGSRRIWLRATGSTLVSQLIDSFVVLFIAFYIMGNWSLKMVLAVGIMNYIYKFIVAIALTPLLYLAHYLIDNYLGIRQAEAITEEAHLAGQ
jgi:queuosine precursor transporter